MIAKALDFTKTALDQYLKNQFVLDEDTVIVNEVINIDGSLPEVNKNKVVLTLINIENETIKPFQSFRSQSSTGNNDLIENGVRYNLYLLMSSNFSNYRESLTFLNAVLNFFQVNPLLSNGSFPNFPQGIDKLTFDVENISFHQMK